MPPRTKRTYSLRPETITRVRELAARYGTSQDATIDSAVERLARAQRDEDEAAAWDAAGQDELLKAEVQEIAVVFDRDDRWPA